MTRRNFVLRQESIFSYKGRTYTDHRKRKNLWLEYPKKEDLRRKDLFHMGEQEIKSDFLSVSFVL